jgi:DNA polymerase V
MSKAAVDKKLKDQLVPLYSGELGCGLFGISDDYVESYLSLDEKFLKNKSSTFFVRSAGDSMLPEIKPGDILIVDKSITVISGAIVAVFFNSNPICKQFISLNGRKILRSFNKEHKDIEISEDDSLEIFGVVVGLARDFVS